MRLGGQGQDRGLVRWLWGFDAGVGGAVAALLFGLAGWGFGVWLAARPRQLRAGCAQSDGGGLEDRGIGTGAGEGDADATGGFDDAGGDLDQPGPQRRELGGSQRAGNRDRLAQLPHQPVGSGVEDEAHLVGVGRSARGAVAFQLGLVELDQVFGLTPGAVERVVDPLGTAVLERGDDEADVEAQARGFDARHDPACVCSPRLGGIAGLGITAQLNETAQRPVGGAGIGGGDDHRIGMKDGIARQTEDIVDAVRLAPRHDLRAAIVPVATQRDVGMGPMAADVPDQPAQVPGNLRARCRLARPQQHRDRAAGRRVVDMDRQKAPLAVVAVPKR